MSQINKNTIYTGITKSKIKHNNQNKNSKN